ncbi:MAG: hypothetical protein AAF235_10310, partial [Planctomycetota bacterium]
AAAPFAVLLIAVIAPLSLVIVPGVSGVDSAIRTGSLAGAGAVQPLMWLAAALIAVPIGRDWAGSTIEQSERAALPS